MFSNSICGGRRVWLILLCLANLDVSSGDVVFELMQAKFEFLHQQIVQLSDFVRSNSESMNNNLETKISQLTEVMNTNAELTKQQVETKISQLTEVMKTNAELTKQQVETKISQLTEVMKTNAESTKQQVETKLAKLTETITNLEQSSKNVQNTASEILTLVSSCQIEHNALVCKTNAAGLGWIVIQQRVDTSFDFDRTWVEYRDGFGSIGPNTSFWWGLEKVHQLTKTSRYELLLEMKKGDEYRFARYSEFEIAAESDKYRLAKLGGYSGTAEDVNTVDSNKTPTGQKFSTKDSDNDRSSGSCANWGGGGWWYYACGDGLNEKRGGVWRPWEGRLTYTRMLIRAKS